MGSVYGTVRDGLECLCKRMKEYGKSVRSIVIDNCCMWRKKITDTFGSNFKVKLDLFHAVKHATTAASKKHSYFHHFIQDFCLVFCAKGDSGHQRMQPTPPPDVLLANIELFTEKWKRISQEESNPILTNSVLSELDQLKKHISIGCLSEVPVEFGTNRNENLHHSLNRWLSGHKIGVDLVVALLSTFFHIWNIKRSSSYRTSPMASFYVNYVSTTVSVLKVGKYQSNHFKAPTQMDLSLESESHWPEGSLLMN